MTTFVLHYRGDWERDELNTRGTLIGSWTRHYADLEDVPEPDRAQFNWMLEHSEPVTQVGAYTYQVRN